jgi:hypothetical protein
VTKWDENARPDPNAESAMRDDGTMITPIEAVVSEKSSKKLHAAAELSQQIADEREKRQSEPVHMDGLKPLPPGMPRLPNGVIPGGSAATTLVPSMRKTIPAPYQRDRIAIDHHGKTWAYMAADQVVKDDIVVDFGKVDDVWERTIYASIGGYEAAVGVQVCLLNISGETRTFAPAEQIRVFRVHEEKKPDTEGLAQENKMIDNEMHNHNFSGETLKAPGEV